MAKGSEQFTWKLYPGVERVCCECGKELLRDDVAVIRTDKKGTRFGCTECRDRRIQEKIEKVRKEMGLS